MQAKTANSNLAAQPTAMCSLDYALADIAAGRINHYNSLDDLIKKIG